MSPALSNLPFKVSYSSLSVWHSGHDVTLLVRFNGVVSECQQILAETFGQFARLAQTGALAGRLIEPWNSGLSIARIFAFHDGSISITLSACKVDSGSLYVLLNLLLRNQEILCISSIEIFDTMKSVIHQLKVSDEDESIYPDFYQKLPFKLINEEPESSAYTFQARCSANVSSLDIDWLEAALNTWVDVVLSGGYELSSIEPASSYVEPSNDGLIYFGSTLEWTIFKLRADPESINGIINIFAVFHKQILPLIALEII